MSTIGDSSGTEPADAETATEDQDVATTDADVSDIVNEEESEETERLSRDLVFDVLKNQRRRYALHYLRHADDSVQLSELAEQVAAWENDTDIEAITAAERKRVYTALYQSHLPKLDDASIVDYNQNRGIVQLSEAAEQLDVYLDLDAGPEIEWCNWYLGVAVAGVGLLLAAALGLPPIAMVSNVVLAGVVVVAYAGVALAHTYHSRYAGIAGETPPEIQES